MSYPYFYPIEIWEDLNIMRIEFGREICGDLNNAQTIAPIATDLGIHLIRVAEIIQPQRDSILYRQILIELFDRWWEECLEGRE
jgi:hypothetical protein